MPHLTPQLEENGRQKEGQLDQFDFFLRYHHEVGCCISYGSLFGRLFFGSKKASGSHPTSQELPL